VAELAASPFLWSLPMSRSKYMLLLATPVIASCALLASLAPVGAADPAKVSAGNYAVESTHAQIQWSTSHFGFNDYFGLFGSPTGTLSLDPANLNASKVSISVPVSSNVTSSEKLTAHMLKADFLNAEKFPTATFESTSVVATDKSAKIAGNLTLLGVTKPVVLDTTFSGAGKNAYNGKETVGFHATTTIKRSYFGMKYGLPLVGDDVKLNISVAFEKQ
jgi:polyisoprenoid-binding protein YceI